MIPEQTYLRSKRVSFMSKAHLCLCGLLAISCLSGTMETDVSLPHDFDFTKQLPADNSVIYGGSVGDCYSPDISKTFQKVNDGSSSTNLHWKITNLNDVATIAGGDPKLITGFSFFIEDSNSSKLEVPAKDVSVDPDGSIHLKPSVDENQLIKFLSGGSIQVCLFLTGNLSKDFPKIVHNDFTFHAEVDVNKRF